MGAVRDERSVRPFLRRRLPAVLPGAGCSLGQPVLLPGDGLPLLPPPPRHPHRLQAGQEPRRRIRDRPEAAGPHRSNMLDVTVWFFGEVLPAKYVFRVHHIFGAPQGDQTDNNKGQWVFEAIAKQTHLPLVLFVGSLTGHGK